MLPLRLAFPVALLLLAASLPSAEPKMQKGVWTDSADPTLPADFKIQGEYAGDKVGCQVIALDGGKFQAVVFAGGLPGAGWDGKSRSLMDGSLGEDGKATFTPATGKRNYKGRKPEEFSATSKFPPEGHKEFTATIDGDDLEGKDADGKAFTMRKLVRKSPTLGLKPPAGATVLFDGTSMDEWKNGRLDKTTKFLNTDGSDVSSKKKFSDYTVHLEFMLPYRPAGRDQERGNSGFYQVQMYEVQVLDSFGLEGKNNECGGLYGKTDCKINGCLPPLAWQTYDVDFTNAVREGDKVVKNSRISVRLNGIVIHDDYEIKGPAGGSRSEPEGTPGPFLLQGHGNPLQYRNIWVAEKK